jgi:dynein heavy chain
MREGVEDASLDKKWYIFDGPVDAIWVESMNTLLDDNKKLCLTSGEIIKMDFTQTMMFEVENLAYASPATVSRCGMIYMEPGALGITPIIKSWMDAQEALLTSTIAATFKSLVGPLFDTLLFPALSFMRKSINELVPTTDGNLTSSLMRLFDCMIEPHRADESGATSPAVLLETLKKIAQPLFVFALIWSAGCTTDNEGRRKFSTWLQETMKTLPEISFPTEGTVYDYLFDTKTIQWVLWMDSIPEFQVKSGRESMVIVPTADSISNTFLLDTLLHHGYHVLCTGHTGTGKSVTVNEKLMNGMDSTIIPITVNFSARTSANQTQDLIDSKCEKRRKGVFGPPVGRKYVIFVDDLNMPMLDICGAQPPVELLRQWMDTKGWYDRRNVGKFMEVVDVTLVAAMGPPGGGRNPVTPRFTRHFNLVSFVEMEDESLQHIFTTILDSFFGRFNEDVQNKVCKFINLKGWRYC